MKIWGDFQGLPEATGAGRGSKNSKIEATSFMDGPLLSFDFFCDTYTERGRRIFVQTNQGLSKLKIL